MKRTSGQVVLITLLVLTIATTVALSLISRTTTDTTITNEVEESSRAFSAAEAGVEEALKTGLGSTSPQILTPGVSYTMSVYGIGGAAGAYEFPKITQKGATEALWLVAHDQNSGALIETPTYPSDAIDICWGTQDETEIPALFVTVLYKEQTTQEYMVAKIGYDPNAARAATNQFVSTYTPGGCEGTGVTDYRVTLNFSAFTPSINPASDTVIALRMRPLYENAKIAIDTGNIVLPNQGKRIESIGSTDTGTNRKIVVYQQYRSPSTIFDAALYSQGSLTY